LLIKDMSQTEKSHLFTHPRVAIDRKIIRRA
jgi:hypothetical protein